MDRNAGKCGSAGGKGSGDGFPFPGFHLRHHTMKQGPAPIKLHIEMAHAKGPLGYLPNEGKTSGYQFIGEALPAKTSTHVLVILLQLVIVHRRQGVFMPPDPVSNLLYPGKGGCYPGRQAPHAAFEMLVKPCLLLFLAFRVLEKRGGWEMPGM